jgi:hypothetical protein
VAMAAAHSASTASERATRGISRGNGTSFKAGESGFFRAGESGFPSRVTEGCYEHVSRHSRICTRSVGMVRIASTRRNRA